MTQMAVAPQVVKANNEFVLEIARRLDNDRSANMFASPFSISCALTLLANGARGATVDEMQAVLGIDVPLQETNAVYADLIQRYNSNSAEHDIHVANAVFVAQNYPLVPNFVSVATQQYSALVQPLNFADGSGESFINQWASAETRGKITGLVKDLRADLRVLLVNTVYFKGQWQNEFTPSRTRPGPFRSDTLGQTQAQIMSNSAEYQHYQDDQVEMVILPYKAPADFEMVILLPAPNSTPERVLSLLNSDNWEQLVALCKPESGLLEVPRFQFSCTYGLGQMLYGMGMQSAFRPDADFSALTAVSGEPFFISDALHMSYVNVDEQGTEAAAATALETMGSAPARRNFEMRIDRPFVFVIQDRARKVILFVGILRNPNV